MWTIFDWWEEKEGNFKEKFLILCRLWGKIFSNLSTEEGWSALGREFCHNTKQIAYQHPGEVHINPGKISYKDEFSKDMAQKHGAPGNRSPGRNIDHPKGWSGELCLLPHILAWAVQTYRPIYGFSHLLVHIQVSLHIVILYLGSHSHIPSLVEWIWKVPESWSLLSSWRA